MNEIAQLKPLIKHFVRSEMIMLKGRLKCIKIDLEYKLKMKKA